MPSLTNQFSTENIVSSTSGSASVGMAFGFMANALRLFNDKATPIYLSLNSTVGSTAGHRTCAGEALSLDAIATEAIGIASTTTTTGTIVRISAFGR